MRGSLDSDEIYSSMRAASTFSWEDSSSLLRNCSERGEVDLIRLRLGKPATGTSPLLIRNVNRPLEEAVEVGFDMDETVVSRKIFHVLGRVVAENYEYLIGYG